ncbi:hypothetical protein cand_017340 [Cryptosporidium andersoni]|uniref:Uncharacterized protein n=1 Tax=Cryptosporidium andersoni TaxID=117008 RepID=A0A1J4MT82_9CRYT|nr:hypothetical protein cand_017340 [Cryptosporidium andersoni]
MDLFVGNPKFLKTELWFRHKGLDMRYFGLWHLLFDFFYDNKKPQDEFELAVSKVSTQMSGIRRRAYPYDPPTVHKGRHCQHVFKVLKIQKCKNTLNFMIYLISLTYGLSSYIQKAILLLFVLLCTHSTLFGLNMRERVEKFLNNQDLRNLLLTESHESLRRYITQCSNESPNLFSGRDSSLVSHNLSIPFIFLISSPQGFGNLSCLVMIELYRSGVSDRLEFPLFLLFLLPRMQSADLSLLLLYLLMEASLFEGSYHTGIRSFFTSSAHRERSLQKITANFGVNLDGFLDGFLDCILKYRSEFLPGAEELNLPEARRYVASARSRN